MGSSNSGVDKPPKIPAISNGGNNLTNAFGLRSKLSGLRSRTLDAYDSHRSHESETDKSNIFKQFILHSYFKT